MKKIILAMVLCMVLCMVSVQAYADCPHLEYAELKDMSDAELSDTYLKYIKETTYSIMYEGGERGHINQTACVNERERIEKEKDKRSNGKNNVNKLLDYKLTK